MQNYLKWTSTAFVLAVTTFAADFAQAECNNCRGANRRAPCCGAKGEDANAQAESYAMQYPWHGNYAHTAYGQPIALVVPPTAHMQTQLSWGVARTERWPIYHQFGREWPGPYEGGVGFYPTPRWPSNTNQFGVYYVRGPW